MATIDYTFHAGSETIEQYNARIAAARGDSAESLASMQEASRTVKAAPTYNKGETFEQYEERASTQQGVTNPLTTVPNWQTINSTNLTQQPEIPYVSPTQTPTYPVAGLGTQVTLSPEEQKAQDLSTKLQELNDQLIGQSAYQTEQEAKYGVPQAQATINDLNSQLTQLKNEAAAIPLQLQQGAADRGVTTPVLGRQENSRLRTNAIAALGVSSLMSAAQGQLANAQSLADRAVEQKYAPIQERITAATANLNIIMSSPLFNAQEKARAEAQLEVQRQKQYDLDIARTETQEIYNLAVQAAASGVDSVTLSKIQNSKTLIEATQIAGAAGVLEDDSSDSSDTPGSDIPDKQTVNQNLYSVGLPLTTAKTDGTLTSTALSKVTAAGVPPDIAQSIWEDIVSGFTLEEIRVNLAAEFGRDVGYAYLDKFMQALQGGGTNGGSETETNTITNPFG